MSAYSPPASSGDSSTVLAEAKQYTDQQIAALPAGANASPFGYLDPAASGPWGAALKPRDAAGPGAYCADNLAAMQAAFTYAAAHGMPVQCGPGTFDLIGAANGRPIEFLAAAPVFNGAGPKNTVFCFKTGAGRVTPMADQGNNSGDYTMVTDDGTNGTGFRFGNNSGNYDNPSGDVGGFTVTSLSAPAPTIDYGGTTGVGPSSAVAVGINGCTQLQLHDIEFSNFGCPFDLLNNSGGSVLTNLVAVGDVCSIGGMLRGTGDSPNYGSGSDITLDNVWLHGPYGAVYVDTNGTDFHFRGGQLSAHGNKMLTAATTPVDGLAAAMIGRNALDGTIGADGLLGAVPSPGIASVGKCTFYKVDFEGSRLCYAVFRSWTLVDVSVLDCNIIAYQANGTAGTTYDVNNHGCGGLFKMQGAGNSTVVFKRNSVKGSFYSTKLVTVLAAGAGFQLTDEDNHGRQNTVIQGYNNGGQCGGNWLAVDVVTGAPTNMMRLSALSGVAYRSLSGPTSDRSGVFDPQLPAGTPSGYLLGVQSDGSLGYDAPPPGVKAMMWQETNGGAVTYFARSRDRKWRTSGTSFGAVMSAAFVYLYANGGGGLYVPDCGVYIVDEPATIGSQGAGVACFLRGDAGLQVGNAVSGTVFQPATGFANGTAAPSSNSACPYMFDSGGDAVTAGSTDTSLYAPGFMVRDIAIDLNGQECGGFRLVNSPNTQWQSMRFYSGGNYQTNTKQVGVSLETTTAAGVTNNNGNTSYNSNFDQVQMYKMTNSVMFQDATDTMFTGCRMKLIINGTTLPGGAVVSGGHWTGSANTACTITLAGSGGQVISGVYLDTCGKSQVDGSAVPDWTVTACKIQQPGMNGTPTAAILCGTRRSTVTGNTLISGTKTLALAQMSATNPNAVVANNRSDKSGAGSTWVSSVIDTNNAAMADTANSSGNYYIAGNIAT